MDLLIVAFMLDRIYPLRRRKGGKTMHSKISVRSISMIGLLVAIEVVLSRFSIHTWNLKIGFNFIPIVVAAILYGPLTAGAIGAIGDIISFVLFPVGAYFPGFTFSAFLTGVLFGLLLKNSQSILQIVITVLLTQIFISLFLNTYWISFLYGSPYWPLFLTRIYQTIAMTVIQILTIIVLCRQLIPVLKTYQF